MTMSPCRSAKCPLRTIHSPRPAANIPASTTTSAAIQSTIRASPPTKAPATRTATAPRLVRPQRRAERSTALPVSTPSIIMARPISTMTPRQTANTGPPGPSAVDTDAAMGTLTAVASRNRSRARRPLPDTALADQVSCDHGTQSRPKRSPARPTPVQSGSWTRCPTSWEKAKTKARSKNSSTGSAVKSSVRSGTSMPLTDPPRRGARRGRGHGPGPCRPTGRRGRHPGPACARRRRRPPVSPPGAWVRTRR